MISDSAVFRAIAETVIPEARQLDEGGWRSLGSIVEHALAQRPAAMQRQLRIFIFVLNVLAFVRYRHTLPQLIPPMRTDFLEKVQNSRVTLIRRGFWGLRTLVFMGYYARPEATTLVGYRANKLGWQAR